MITARGVASPVGLFLLVLALGAIAVAARGQSTSGQRTVLASSVPTHSRHLVAGSGSSCPLSLPEQEKSVKAFAEMVPVFRHPRCSNCHGGVNPFVDEEIGGHGGGEQEPGDAGCQDCHDQLPGWTVPGTPMFFPGRSDEEICLQFKDMEDSGPSFVEHIRHDHGLIQFIAAGFTGRRALGPDHEVKIDKPPGTQAQLTEKARKWVKTLRGDWKESRECGCVRGKIELKMTSEWTATGGGNTATAKVTATVPLKPDSSGLVFTGKAPLEHGQNTMTAPPGCRVDLKPGGGELKVTEARFDLSGEKGISISLAMAPSMSAGTMTFVCPKVPFPVMPILPWSGEWQYLHQPDLIGREYHFDEFKAAPSSDFGGERKLIGSKKVSRKVSRAGMTSTSKTTFEFWWLGLKAK